MDLKEEFLSLLERDKEFRYAVAGLLGLEEILRSLDKHGGELTKLREDLVKLREDLVKLREDMNAGFMLVERHISALGARWGLISEEAFREGIKGLIEKEFGFKVERWIKLDEKGFIFGYPSWAEIDVAVRDEKVILIEVKSHVRTSDVYAFKRKAEFYEQVERRGPSKLLMVTPYADGEAIEAAKHLNVEIYTKL
ncbi:MAG: PD-(D/E)XK nuclease family protein [Nitrososphaerales archaeon]